jgi:hypothetical protein
MRAFTRTFIFVLALVSFWALAAADMDWRFPSDKITAKQWETFRTEVLAKPGIERQEFANQLVLTSLRERRIYVFTEPAHPAYPAVVVRAVVPTTTGSDVQRMGHYAGDEKAFNKWWHEFDALDARIPGQLNK